MSIPLVQNNEKDSINASIIAIKKNLERINSLLGLMDSSEPDLSGLATKQELEDTVSEINNTIDEVETSLQPIDTVTNGDMHSVTSNAVANAFNPSGMQTLYDTNEVLLTMQTLGKLAIFNITAKVNGLKIYNIPTVYFTNAGCDTLIYGGSAVGECYISNSGTTITANVVTGSWGSGQIVAFLQ